MNEGRSGMGDGAMRVLQLQKPGRLYDTDRQTEMRCLITHAVNGNENRKENRRRDDAKVYVMPEREKEKSG